MRSWSLFQAGPEVPAEPERDDEKSGPMAPHSSRQCVEVNPPVARQPGIWCATLAPSTPPLLRAASNTKTQPSPREKPHPLGKNKQPQRGRSSKNHQAEPPLG